MEIRFFPLDFDYKVKDGKTYIYLYGKLEDNSPICVAQEYRPYFYAKIEETDQEELTKRLKQLRIEDSRGIAEVTEWKTTKLELLGKKEKFWKIFVSFPKAVPLVSKEISSWGLNCYEKDILFVYRYLRDQQIIPMTLCQADGKFVQEKELRVPVFLAEEVSQYSKEISPKIKMLALDIETYSKNKIINPNKDPILMLALYGINETGQEFKKVFTWKKFKHNLDCLELVADEKELIQQFKETILSYQPNLLVGYSSDAFDLPYIKVRADKYKIKLNLGLDYSELNSGNDFGGYEKESKIKGILHLDLFKFIRYIFNQNLKTESYSLNAVSEELLGTKKLGVDLNELANIWDNHPEKLEPFCKYNLHDAYLTLNLCQKLMYDLIEFSKITGLPLFDLIRMRFSRLVENYILKRAIEFKVIAPNKPGRNEIDQRVEETYEGGFVFEPVPGLYKDIVVFDFRSLYPTIITAHNIGPESFHCSCCKQKSKVPEQDQFWFCTKKKAFIPLVLEQLVQIRAELKKTIKEAKSNNSSKNSNNSNNSLDLKMLEARSYALKILANSFYGYLGFFGARWYCLECAKSTTAYARNYIKKTIAKAEENGFKVIYSDTDSCFILLGDKNLDQANEFMKKVNADLPNQMELEMEGYYPQGIFVAAKGSEKGAKKKYALINPQGKIKITGFETVRRNWSALAKEVQEKVLQLVLQDKAPAALNYVRETIEELKKNKVPLQKLIIKTHITKELSRYTSIGPHVAVAKKLVEKNIPVLPGMTVEYIITKGSGLVRERAKFPEDVKAEEYDHEYYVNHQIIPAVLSIFSVLGYKENDLISSNTQVGLSKFF